MYVAYTLKGFQTKTSLFP